VDLLTEALETHSQNDELHGDLGDAYVDLGQTQEALEAYRRAAELDPDDAEWKNKLSLLGD
jgi:Flp pilus assembly protein TadD